MDFKERNNWLVLHTKNFSSCLALCASLREKNPTTPFHIVIEGAKEKGQFVFPYSNFYLSCSNFSLVGDAYAKEKDEQGHEKTTWKTATLKILGHDNIFENLTIINEAGDPATKGQEVALAIYNNHNTFYHCHLVSTQDTLFVGPLPDDLVIRYENFLPSNERLHEGNYHNDFISCLIEGSVDFIFGAGQASFYECELRSVFDGRNEPSYVFAPAHALGDSFGFFAYKCHFSSLDLKEETVFLSRPWRDYGKVVLSECLYDKHIKKEGFSNWENTTRTLSARYEEYPLKEGRIAWIKNKIGESLPDQYKEDIARITALIS